MALANAAPNVATPDQMKKQHRGWKLVAFATVFVVCAIVAFILSVTAPHYCIDTWVPRKLDGAQSRTGGSQQEVALRRDGEIDPCDAQFIKDNFSTYVNRITFMCSTIGASKRRFRELRDEQACHHYAVQISILLLGALATIFVAMRDTNEHLARLAIIPTALVTLMAGISGLYGFQDRFLSAAGVANSVAVIEGQLEYSLLRYADRPRKSTAELDLETAKELDGDLTRWHAKLEDTMSGDFSHILKAMGESRQVEAPPSGNGD